jgi:glycosyltransferase involved in cell wall biosynthesis
MHYAVPRILHNAGLLESFYTDLVSAKGWPKLVSRLAATGSRAGAARRMVARAPDGMPPGMITHWPAFGMEYFFRRRRAISQGETTAVNLWAGREFCRRIVKRGLGNATSVYTFNSAGLELLVHARDRGVFRVMEQTIAPAEVEDELLAAEESDFPGWEEDRGRDSYRREFQERERAEWASADIIVCGSEFVREGIRNCGGPADRCRVASYGFSANQRLESTHSAGQTLRVLTIGTVNLRKGAPYVLGAAKSLGGAAQFRMVGPISVTLGALQKIAEHVEVVGPVPRPEVAQHYAWADVFLLPSICEGSATVCYEALAAGLPVITTPNAGSVVRDGIEGFIIPIRDSDAIADRLDRLISDPGLLAEMSQNAHLRAQEFTVQKYGERLLAATDTATAVRNTHR